MVSGKGEARHVERGTEKNPASLPYTQSVAGCSSDIIGPYGLSASDLAPWTARADTALEGLRADYRNRTLPLLRIAEEEADIAAAAAALEQLSEGAANLIFFGTGGSGLGGQALAQLSGWNLPGNTPARHNGRPRTRFHDNLDPRTLQTALANLDLGTTRFIVTSKSGGTAETLAQIIATLAAVKAAGLEARIPQMFLGITEPAVAGKANGLRTLLSSFGIPILEHPPGIGGRFSCLSIVGLLPAMARGLDVRAIRAGARLVVDQMMVTRAVDFAPAVGAATAIALSKAKGVHTLVLMPYADRLGRLASWFVQLWAESLGKSGDGTSAIAALGPVDQHSQLQLFMDGPREHYLTFIRVPTAGTGPRIDPAMAKVAGFDVMAGRTVGDLVDAQSHAITDALGRAGRPVRTIDLETLDETSFGAVLMHLMLETIIAGRLLGIDPFDQPAVELAKVLTRERLAVKG